MSSYSAMRPLSVLHVRGVGRCRPSWSPPISPRLSGSSLRVAPQQSFFSSSSSKPSQPPPTPGALLEGAVRQLMQPHIDEAGLQVQRLREEVLAAANKETSKEASKDVSKDAGKDTSKVALVPLVNEARHSLRQEVLLNIDRRFQHTQKYIVNASVMLNKRATSTAKAEAKLDQALASLKAELHKKPDLDELSKIIAAEMKERGAMPVKEKQNNGNMDAALESLTAELRTKPTFEELSTIMPTLDTMKRQVQALEERPDSEDRRVSKLEASVATKLTAADFSQVLEAHLNDESSALHKALAARLTSAAAQQLINTKVEKLRTELKAELQAEMQAKLRKELQDARALIAEQVQKALSPLQSELRAKLSAEDATALVAEQVALIPVVEERPAEAKPVEDKPPQNLVGTVLQFLSQFLTICAAMTVALAGLALMPAKAKRAAPAVAPQEEK